MSTTQHFQTNALYPGGEGKSGIGTHDPYPDGIPGNVFKINKSVGWLQDLLWRSRTLTSSCFFQGSAAKIDVDDGPSDPPEFTLAVSASGNWHSFAVYGAPYDGSGNFYEDEDSGENFDISSNKWLSVPARICGKSVAAGQHYITGNLENVDGAGNYSFLPSADFNHIGYADPNILAWDFSTARSFTDGDSNATEYSYSFAGDYSYDSVIHADFSVGISFVRLLGNGTVDVYVRFSSASISGQAGLTHSPDLGFFGIFITNDSVSTIADVIIPPGTDNFITYQGPFSKICQILGESTTVHFWILAEQASGLFWDFSQVEFVTGIQLSNYDFGFNITPTELDTIS